MRHADTSQFAGKMENTGSGSPVPVNCNTWRKYNIPEASIFLSGRRNPAFTLGFYEKPPEFLADSRH